jgi:polysaccharide pyruvyl transferase WcaK-like protein
MKTAILVNDTSGEHHIGCNAVVATIKRLCKERNIEITQTFTRQDVRNKMTQLTTAIASCDIVIINGEGSCHDGYGRNWFIPLLQMLPNKKAVLINSVWYNMGTIDEMGKLALISFRESNSYMDFMQHHNFIPATITPDVIFAVKPELFNIGYGDSVFGNKTSLLNKHDNFFPLDYHREISKAKYLMNMKENSVDTYLAWLHTLDLYITGRFHGVCLSAIAGTPFLTMASNAHKIEGILKDMGCEELLISSMEEVPQKIVLAKKIAYKPYQYAIEAYGKVHQLFDKIENIVYGK